MFRRCEGMRDLTGKGQGEESMLGSPTQSTLSDRMDGHRAARSRRRATGSSGAGKSTLQRVQQEDDGDLSSEGGQDSDDSSDDDDDDDDDSNGVKYNEIMERLKRVDEDLAAARRFREARGRGGEAAAQRQLRLIAEEVERQMRPLRQEVGNLRQQVTDLLPLRAENDLQAADILRLRAQVSRLQGEGDRETNGD